MNYNKLKPASEANVPCKPPSDAAPVPDPDQDRCSLLRRHRLITVSLLSLVLILASAIGVTLLVYSRTRPSSSSLRPTEAISRTCGRTLYPELCISSLLNFPGSLTASEQDLVQISFNMTLQRFSKALYLSSSISYLNMDATVRSAFDDCLELLDDAVDTLSMSLNSLGGAGGSRSDVVTWLSAAMTMHDTCTEGFEEVGGGDVKKQVEDRVKDLGELVSNCLAIYVVSDTQDNGDFAGVPIGNRRLMSSLERKDGDGEAAFPEWLGKEERELLETPAAQVQADIVVSKDGSNGTFKSIAEAIKKAPEHSGRRIIIYVKAGRYEETNLKVGRRKTNLMFIGDGRGKTVISGGRSVAEKITTFHTASFAASGAGFIARDMTFENYAGPSKHQAVALRVGADHGVVYRCDIIGYQDTLYVHSNRQFYRECDIYGTVDFIFGNAAVVIQKCTIHSRKPMDNQKNTITAQNRKDPNQNTGISIHDCQLLATSDLEAAKGSIPTYLGRPWKMYSRVVYLLSSMGDHINPSGWLEWSGSFALETLYYGEYMNYGPGAALGRRVKWPGYRVITSVEEASKFTVAQFIFGSSWLPSTGVAFLAGLST